MLGYTLNNSLATQLCHPETLHAAPSPNPEPKTYKISSGVP